MSTTCSELKVMLAQKTEVYLLLDQKYCEMLKDLEQMQDLVNKKDMEILEMKEQFNESIKTAENELLVTRYELLAIDIGIYIYLYSYLP